MFGACPGLRHRWKEYRWTRFEAPDPWGYMQDLAGRIDALSERREIERALDDMEYLMKVLDPELQEPAYALVERLRSKLNQVGS